MGVHFDDLSTPAGLKKLDEYLLTRSYITGYQASRDDLAVFGALKGVSAEYVNVSRWYSHIAALAGPRFSTPGVGVQLESGAAPDTTSRDVAPPAAPADDDEDLDLFGDETEEEKAAADEREAAKKAAAGAKKKESGKSSVLLDVKPWDDETDMVKLEECVRAVQMPGLHWGASKLQTVVAGIKKLSIMMTIVDDEVSVDNLIEDFLTSEPNNEYIQSCDIVAFNKI
jgi:elongation factor 1-beta